MVLEITKNIENISLWWVRKKSREIIDYVKENKVKRSISNTNMSLLRRKSSGMRPALKSRKSGDFDKPISTQKVWLC
jgi:hypothetical protein